ncbi:nitrile hydratase subunit alpha [Dietzia sp. PP-33]|jgi:nitrile hydratase|uniref:nitrile hydratase subunit alpha n=1 Tax=Dietzia sp. PP-33 TaxID=2957500 RepID=UPI0029AABC84|nr:nitrile hydratase subunit alpha [Dietzia sp. PP-33]MDX2358360.1 nitrile hydratase subunit alpha [Dietzia sp. PP-33]
MAEPGFTSSNGYTAPPAFAALRVKAIQSLLVDKGIVLQESMDEIADIYENQVGPHLGAGVIARAWTDPEFKARLLQDGTATLHEIDLSGFEGSHVVFVENTPTVHNVVTCTLCSCYPWVILGLPPSWFKAAPYRARIAYEPRKVLEEFGTSIPDDVEVRVWDSNAEIRYVVIPQRPSGTEGWDVDRLAQLVVRDSMLGTRVLAPIEGVSA